MLDITKSQIRKCDRAALLRLARVLHIPKPETLLPHVLQRKVRDYMQAQSGPKPRRCGECGVPYSLHGKVESHGFVNVTRITSSRIRKICNMRSRYKDTPGWLNLDHPTYATLGTKIYAAETPADVGMGSPHVIMDAYLCEVLGQYHPLRAMWFQCALSVVFDESVPG